MVALLAQSAGTPSNYALVKEWLLPLAGPAVTLTVALLFFWLVPGKQRRKDLAIRLWQIFNSGEMQLARRESLDYIHGTCDPATTVKRIAEFWEWSLAIGPRPPITPEMATFYQLQKVLDFFAACENCLATNQVDRKLLKSLLGFYFSLWSADTIEVVRANAPTRDYSRMTQRPSWLLGMPRFALLVGLERPFRIQGT
ncbi:MAG TPA: hypothetical protein VNT79_13395 [Phycisphaerae bacterium]|nr:hypothetical protein [Phycisphaerae bacterium]